MDSTSRTSAAVAMALYSVLINQLCRDPVESMAIMALWIWLCQAGLHDVIFRVFSLPLPLINGICDEAAICLECIHGTAIFSVLNEPTDLTLTKHFIRQEITLQFFHDNRVDALHGIGQALNQACLTGLTDLMEAALVRNRRMQSQNTLLLPVNNPVVSSSVQVGSSRSVQVGSSRSVPMGSSSSRSVSVGSVPVGSSRSVPMGSSSSRSVPVGSSRSQGRTFYVGESSRSQTRVNTSVPPELRSMFVTFSRGYAVGVDELRYFFSRVLGDCIEAIQMQDVEGDEQALYARVVFRDPAIIDEILNGLPIAKFAINGKHIWMRRFDPYQRSRS